MAKSRKTGLSKFLLGFRTEKGWTQIELQDRIGQLRSREFNPQYVSKIETGAIQEPNDDFLEGLATLANLSVEELRKKTRSAASDGGEAERPGDKLQLAFGHSLWSAPVVVAFAEGVLERDFEAWSFIKAERPLERYSVDELRPLRQLVTRDLFEQAAALPYPSKNPQFATLSASAIVDLIKNDQIDVAVVPTDLAKGPVQVVAHIMHSQQACTLVASTVLQTALASVIRRRSEGLSENLQSEREPKRPEEAPSSAVQCPQEVSFDVLCEALLVPEHVRLIGRVGIERGTAPETLMKEGWARLSEDRENPNFRLFKFKGWEAMQDLSNFDFSNADLLQTEAWKTLETAAESPVDRGVSQFFDKGKAPLLGLVTWSPQARWVEAPLASKGFKCIPITATASDYSAKRELSYSVVVSETTLLAGRAVPDRLAKLLSALKAAADSLNDLRYSAASPLRSEPLWAVAKYFGFLVPDEDGGEGSADGERAKPIPSQRFVPPDESEECLKALGPLHFAVGIDPDFHRQVTRLETTQ